MLTAHESTQDGRDSRNTRNHGIPLRPIAIWWNIFSRRVQSSSLGNCKMSEIGL